MKHGVSTARTILDTQAEIFEWRRLSSPRYRPMVIGILDWSDVSNRVVMAAQFLTSHALSELSPDSVYFQGCTPKTCSKRLPLAPWQYAAMA